jgi:uncharacterized protein YijF (DUF1287 family)
MLNRRALLIAAATWPLAGRARAEPPAAPPVTPRAAALIAAARAQIGVTIAYDGAYAQLAYPMGDVPRERGVCTDVVIRAGRDAWQSDLQQGVHEDMAVHFHQYPQAWGLTRPDPNIDHRRVPNLRTFFARQGAALADDAVLEPGDLVTMIVPPHLPHIAIVSDARSADGARYLILHNIGRGTQEEDRLADFEITGRYRWTV